MRPGMMNRYTGDSLRNAAKILPRRATASLGAPKARCTMYWSVHQYHRPITGAQNSMPSHGKLSLKYQADNGRAEQHAEPWEIVVEVPGLLDDLADGVGLNHRRPGTLYTGGDERLPEVEHIGAAQAAQLVPASQADQAVGGQQERAEDEDRDLHGVVVSHGAHAAQRGVKAGEHDHQHRADPKAVDNDAADMDGHLREQRAEDDAAGEDADRDFGDDESDYGDDGEDVTGLLVEAAHQEFRHGEDHGAHVERHEDPAQHQQGPGVQLVVRHGDAAGGAGAGQPHDVLRADVGGEDGGADDPPAQVAAGEEVIGGGVLGAADHPRGHAQQNAEVDRDCEALQRGDARLAGCGKQQQGW